MATLATLSVSTPLFWIMLCSILAGLPVHVDELPVQSYSPIHAPWANQMDAIKQWLVPNDIVWKHWHSCKMLFLPCLVL